MIRKTILGLGLCGLLNGSAQATDVVKDTGYSQMSLGEITKSLQEKTIVLSDLNFKKEVLNYDGAALVLFYSTCNQTEYADNIDRNMEIVYLQLADTFQSAQVNHLPLKFTSFDGCKYKGPTKETILGLHVVTTETHMYLDGRELDRMKGGPKSEEGIAPKTRDMFYWVEYTLLGKRLPEDKDRDIVLLYKGDYSWEEFPRSEIQK